MTKKLNISKGSVRQTVKEWTIITLGVLLYSFAWVSIILPADGMGGGATGIAMLVYYATGGIDGGVPIGISYFVVNAILITAAVFIIGAKFGIKTIYSIILMSIAMSVMQAVIPNDGRPVLSMWLMVGGLLLNIVMDYVFIFPLGGGVAGLGISLVLMQGGSTGGSDIIAMIINKYRNISYGRVVLVTDCIIIGASYFIEHNLAQVIYGYVLTATFSVTADVMLAGNKQSAQIFVMSEHYKEIADLITNDFHRGVTLLDGTGWYTKKPTKVIMVMVRKNESTYMLSKIKALDSKAFITMGSVMGVYGEGFDTFRK